jgi:hypothetical protein
MRQDGAAVALVVDESIRGLLDADCTRQTFPHGAPHAGDFDA